MTEKSNRESEPINEEQQDQQRSKSLPLSETGTHMTESSRMSGGIPRGGQASPADISEQQGVEGVARQDRTIGQD